MQAGGHRSAHERVIARVKLHLVDALPLRTVGVQHRTVAVGQPSMGLHIGLAQLLSQGLQGRQLKLRRQQAQAIAQAKVAFEEIMPDQRLALVEYHVRAAHGTAPVARPA